MSLLMDALRKAEEAKSKGDNQEKDTPALPEGQHQTASPEDLAKLEEQQASEIPHHQDNDIETIAFTPGKPSPRPAPATVPDNQAAEPDPQPVPTSGDAATADAEIPAREEKKPETIFKTVKLTEDQMAAATVFAAKQPGRHRKPLIGILLAAMILTLVSGAGGLWYLSQNSDSFTLDPNLVANANLSQRGFIDDQISTAGSNTADGLSSAAETSAALSRADNESMQSPAAEPENQATRQPERYIAAADDTETDTSEPASPPFTTEATVTEPLSETIADRSFPPAAAAGQNQEIIIRKSTPEPRDISDLQAAYRLYQAGQYQQAAVQYQSILAKNPLNRDALIALAAIAFTEGDYQKARELYVRVLVLNPQDAYARTGLLTTIQSNESDNLEEDLQSLLAQHENIAPLHFALGNFYAGRQRWQEAQAAYFQALLLAGRNSQAPVSPDYAFNLAVSLEQLNKPSAALDYYRRAAELSRESSPGFDPALLQSRLEFLEGALP